MHKRLKFGRDAALVLLGAALLASQGVKSLLGGDADPAIVTAATSILVSPLVLRRDEKQDK